MYTAENKTHGNRQQNNYTDESYLSWTFAVSVRLLFCMYLDLLQSQGWRNNIKKANFLKY